MEVDRKGRTYTYETLETLREQNPDAEYYFILGADSLWKVEAFESSAHDANLFQMPYPPFKAVL